MAVVATPRVSRVDTIVISAIALVVGACVMDQYSVGVFHDDAMYLVLAKSMATGQGYRYINLPDAPFASHFPPLYPAVLSLIWRLAPNFPANVVAFKAMNVLLLAAIAWLTVSLVRERLGSAWLARAIGITTAVSVPLLVLVTMVLSEPLFIVLVLATLIFSERLVTSASATPHIIAIGLLIGVASLVRAHGIVLLPALAIPLLLQRRWRDVTLALATALVIIAPWQLWGRLHAADLAAPLQGNYGSYAAWWLRGYDAMGLRLIPATLMRTIPETASMLVSLFSVARSPVVHDITGVALCIALLVGGVALWRSAPVTALFMAGYFAIVLVWPFAPSRFVWGLWPLVLMMLAAAGWAARAEARWPAAVRATVLACSAWLAVGYASYEFRAIRGQWWSSISRAASPRVDSVVAWTRANTARDAVVAADDEGAVFLYTGRHSVPVASFTTADYLGTRTPAVEAAEGLVPLLARYPISVVLVGSPRTFDAAQYLASGPSPLLVLRDQFAGGAAFTVLPR